MSTQSASQIYSEIAKVEAQIESGEAKGKLTVLKAYHRKLCSQYRAALEVRS